MFFFLYYEKQSVLKSCLCLLSDVQTDEENFSRNQASTHALPSLAKSGRGKLASNRHCLYTGKIGHAGGHAGDVEGVAGLAFLGK